jgi:hypothetical protein
MALRSLGVDVINSLGEADKEIAKYCISNNCYGVLGNDSDYLIYPIPHYFTTKDIHVGEKKVDMVCHDREKLCRFLRISPHQMPILAGLCGNDILDASRLTGFHQRLTGLTDKLMFNEVIIKVAQFIRGFPDKVSGEEIAAHAFQSSSDHRIGLFKEVLAMYDLTTMTDTYLTSKDTKPVCYDKHPLASDGPTEDTFVDHHLVFDTKDINKPWVTIDVDSLFDNDVNDDTCDIQGDSNGDLDMKDYNVEGLAQASDTACGFASSKDTPCVTQDLGPSHHTHNWPCIHPAVMDEARRRHVAAMVVHLVYQVLCVGEIDMGPTLEDPGNQNNLPPAVVFFQPIRERLYGIMLGVREKEPGQSVRQLGDISDENYLIWGKNAVKEWCVYNGNAMSASDIVPACPVPLHYLSLEELWIGHREDKFKQQMEAFCYCLGWPEMPYETLPQRRLLLCGVLHFMVHQSDEVPILEEWELDAFLVQATDPKLMCSSTYMLHKMRIPKPNCRAVELAAMFMRGLYVAVFAYNACGLTNDDDVTSPWLCFNGKLFHQKYLELQQGLSIKEICSHRGRQIDEILQLKVVIKSGCAIPDTTCGTRSTSLSDRCQGQADMRAEPLLQPQTVFTGEHSNSTRNIPQTPSFYYSNELQQDFSWIPPFVPSAIPFPVPLQQCATTSLPVDSTFPFAVWEPCGLPAIATGRVNDICTNTPK